MNPDLDRLQAYPFEKLHALKAGLTPEPALAPIMLSIGAPQHPMPDWLKHAFIEHIDGIQQYPTTKGTAQLRTAIRDWLRTRYTLPQASVDPERHILPVSGTREALFAIAQVVVQPLPEALVLMPNPFYQIYEGAALLAHTQPYFLNINKDTDFLPDFEQIPASVWTRCQLLYLCTPGNPTGAVMQEAQLRQAINLAQQYNFVIACDECYSEIYHDESHPPPGLLQAAHNMGNTTFEHCIVFNSLSKRSNAPGLRSGFVAGHAELMRRFLQYRTYQGCTLPIPTQQASIAAWRDESHVIDNRRQYRQKFDQVTPILASVMDVTIPDAGFFLWPKTPIDDIEFTRRLYQTQNVTVLPGQYLSRPTADADPGKNHVRLALVAQQQACVEAAHRIKNCLASL